MTLALRATTTHLARTLAAVIILTAARGRALAQASPTATGPGDYISVGATISAFQADYGKRVIEGGAIYADANLTWRFGLEAEFRSLRYNTEADVRESTLLAGPRFTFRPQGLMPYAKFLAGVGRFDFPYQYGRGTYFVLAPGAGLDYSLGSRFTLRLIDVEYQDWPQFTFGQLHPYGASAGISVRLANGERYPRSHRHRLR